MSRTETTITPGSFRAWVLAARPATLTAALTPVLVGTACAFHAGSFRPGPALAALAGALLIQIGSNLANDLFDFQKGTDTETRLGPVRVTQHGLLTPGQVRAGMIAAFLLASLAGVYLIAAAGWVIVVIGALSIASAVLYTAGPRPLGYIGLGDPFVFLFFGLVAVCGTTYVQTGDVPLTARIASIPIGALATAILVVNNVRDCDTDRTAGKKTLPARFGRKAGRIEFALLLAAAYVSTPLLAIAGGTGPYALLPLVTLPLAVRETIVLFSRTDGPSLNRSLKRTAHLLFLYGVLLAAGLFFAAGNGSGGAS